MALYRESYVFVLETDDPAVFWTGYGDLILPYDWTLAFPTVALGAGELVNLPDLESLINGSAQRVEVTLSGVSPETLRFAQEEAPQVPGAAARVGRVRFDDDWQLAGGIEWDWAGEGQRLTVAGDAVAGGGRSRSITLHLASGETTRTRSPNAFFTDADQQTEYPGDTFFAHVAKINAGTSRRFGPR